ncbi:unnamed protein product [Rotaria socialis]
MEETTSKIFAHLHLMKNFLCKKIKRTPQFCGNITNHNDTYYCPTSYYSMTDDDDDDIDLLSESAFETLTNIKSEDAISSISADSLDSGVSTVSDFSHCSLKSSSSLSISLLNRTATMPQSSHLRCDPSIINYLSHNLLSNHHLEYFLDEIDNHDIDELPSTQIPLAESSRRVIYDSDQTVVADEEDEQIGPLTSTLVDRWHAVTKTYSATFRDDLTVRKNELVQVLRCSHPHWIWVRNEKSQEGFIPCDCLMLIG